MPSDVQTNREQERSSKNIIVLVLCTGLLGLLIFLLLYANKLPNPGDNFTSLLLIVGSFSGLLTVIFFGFFKSAGTVVLDKYRLEGAIGAFLILTIVFLGFLTMTRDDELKDQVEVLKNQLKTQKEYSEIRANNLLDETRQVRESADESVKELRSQVQEKEQRIKDLTRNLADYRAVNVLFDFAEEGLAPNLELQVQCGDDVVIGAEVEVVPEGKKRGNRTAFRAYQVIPLVDDPTILIRSGRRDALSLNLNMGKPLNPVLIVTISDVNGVSLCAEGGEREGEKPLDAEQGGEPDSTATDQAS